MNYRLLQVNENIQRELSRILLEEGIAEQGLITITSVLTSPDLRQATVWLSILNNPKPVKMVELLNKRSYELYEPLSKRLRMKYVPALEFKLDDKSQELDQVDAIIEGLSS